MKTKNVRYRAHQYLLSKAQYFLPWHMPKVISGAGSIYKLPRQVQQDGVKKVLFITTAGFIKRGSLARLFEEFEKESIPYAIYSEVQPDPTIDCIEAAVNIYKREACGGIIAVGGGSVIDCAKIVGARIVKPQQSIIEMTGMLKIRKKLPPLYAVPTTSGTGSEVTVSAVITDGATHYKYPVNDVYLLPQIRCVRPGAYLRHATEFNSGNWNGCAHTRH